jgi:hypothetical protein
MLHLLPRSRGRAPTPQERRSPLSRSPVRDAGLVGFSRNEINEVLPPELNSQKPIGIEIIPAEGGKGPSVRFREK